MRTDLLFAIITTALFSVACSSGSSTDRSSTAAKPDSGDDAVRGGSLADGRAGRRGPPDSGNDAAAHRSNADASSEGSDGDTRRSDATVPSDAGHRTSNCFASPGACGFPDPAYGNVGPTAPCASLTPSGSITVSQAGSTVQHLNVTGSITVNAANVTLSNVCVSLDGAGNYNNGPAVTFSAPGGVIHDATVRGANATTQSMQAALNGSGTATRVYLYNCGECIHGGPWTVNDSYIESNAADFEGGYAGDAGQGEEDHHEGVYLATSSFTGTHDTILNPFGETATVFGDTYNNGGVCGNHITIKSSLLAGGGYLVYTCGNQTSAGTSTMNISNNRFARCLTMAVYDMDSGGTACAGGADSHGYWPGGGYFGIDAYTNCPPMAGQTWESNVWDDDGDTVGCQ